ncbi:MAG: hypothetical protein K9N23_13535 [Akkermansiaceae bacterium]|nr:hypothetical protein [Akkermansiaceae bacterium]
MVFSNNIERRFGWLAFPGFLRYFAILDALVYLLTLVQPNIGLTLMLDWDRVMAGEVWRLITGLFAVSGLGMASSFGVLFKFFMVMIAFMISDALEGSWGVFKTTMFCYLGVIGAIAATLVQPSTSLIIGYFFYESAFFAFATIFPRVEFRLFFILPVQVRFLAMLAAVFLIWDGFSSLTWWGVIGLAFANYLLWAGIPALRGKSREVKSAGRRRQFNAAAKASSAEGLYRCAVCDRTDVSNPELEFRVGEDGRDYCQEHLAD